MPLLKLKQKRNERKNIFSKPLPAHSKKRKIINQISKVFLSIYSSFLQSFWMRDENEILHESRSLCRT